MGTSLRYPTRYGMYYCDFNTLLIELFSTVKYSFAQFGNVKYIAVHYSAVLCYNSTSGVRWAPNSRQMVLLTPPGARAHLKLSR